MVAVMLDEPLLGAIGVGGLSPGRLEQAEQGGESQHRGESKGQGWAHGRLPQLERGVAGGSRTSS